MKALYDARTFVGFGCGPPVVKHFEQHSLQNSPRGSGSSLTSIVDYIRICFTLFLIGGWIFLDLYAVYAGQAKDGDSNGSSSKLSQAVCAPIISNKPTENRVTKANDDIRDATGTRTQQLDTESSGNKGDWNSFNRFRNGLRRTKNGWEVEAAACPSNTAGQSYTINSGNEYAEPALREVAGAVSPQTRSLPTGGLWISGDVDDALSKLRWIAGPVGSSLLQLNSDGRISFDLRKLESSASLWAAQSGNPAQAITSFLRSDEGLLLLSRMIGGSHKFLIHIGRFAPTRGGNVPVRSTINLDNQFDSRINPRRTLRQKVDAERPPGEFDSLIAMNPSAQLYNLLRLQFVPPGEFLMHELAESYMRVEKGYDYLPRDGMPGAHETAIECELRLKKQRPTFVIVPVEGLNYVVGSLADWDHVAETLKHLKQSER